MKKIRKIDIEPKWVDVLRMTTPDNLSKLKLELKKAMKIADIVRQAQKRKKTLVIYPSGKVVEK